VVKSMRVLRLAFPDAEAFQREYVQNLVNGGVFVGTIQAFELREPVRVEIVLAFSKKKLRLNGEIVHIVPREMSQVGATPGVAVQFEGSVQEIRARLDPLVIACGTPLHQPTDSGRRRQPRVAARVAARIEGEGERIEGHTRNLSRSGALVSVPGQGVQVGERVRVTLEHPTSGEAMEVDARVARQVETAGAVAALGIEFDPPAERRADVERFVENLQTAEHTRRLGGIAGAISAMGAQDLVQMFGTSAQVGTLIFHRGEHEACVGFQGGMLRYARLGPATGMKALVRMLAWKEGHFEFHARLDPVKHPEAPLPLEAALLDAVRQIDEGNRIDRRRFPLDAVPRVTGSARDVEGKTLEAVIDLARAGMTVQRILDVIPVPDPEIYAAFVQLADAGAISFDASR
jgi:Tfp pilus assembly protein PilZ